MKRHWIAITAIALPCILATTACDPPMFDCADDNTCDLVEQRYALTDQDIEGRQSRVFHVEGVRYELVHFEYGPGRDCMSGCFRSHFCTVVVDGDQDYPAYFSFQSDEEKLFDPLGYCPDLSAPSFSSNADCDMPAYDLPLLESARFRSWVLYPANENDELRWCRNSLSKVLTAEPS